MIKEAIGIGRGVEEARERALEQLGPQQAEVQLEVLDLPKKSFFGLKQTPARVRAYVILPDLGPKPEPKAAPKPEQKPEQKPQPKPEIKQEPKPEPKAPAAAEASPDTEQQEPPRQRKPRRQSSPRQPGDPSAPQREIDPEQVEKARGYLSEVVGAMGLSNLTLTPGTQNGSIHIRVEGEDSSAVIGRRGETLDALQYLTSLASNRGEGGYVRVVIDTGGYREARQDTLSALGRRLAERVVRTGRSHTLEPMNAYERRLIHSAVGEIKGAASASVGEEPNRRVVISSKRHGAAQERPAAPRRDRRPADRPERPERPERTERPADRPERTDRPADRADRPAEHRAERTDRPAERPDRPDRDRRGSRDRNDRDRRPRREKPAPYVESSTREVAPTEAEDKPLYGKIEL